MSQQKQTYATTRLGVGDMVLVKGGHPATVSLDKESGAYSAHVIYSESNTPSLRSDAEWTAATADNTSDEVNVAVPLTATAVACRVTAITGEATPRAGARMEVNLTSGVDLLGFNHRKRANSGRQFPDFPIAPPFTPPFPAGVEPVHHFDATQPGTVWQDVAGLIPATNGSIVKRVDNLGSDPTALIQEGVTAPPKYATGVVNGLNTLAFGDGLGEVGQLESTTGTAHSTTTLGLTMAMVLRRTASFAAGGSTMGQWGVHSIFMNGSNQVQGRFFPNGFKTLGTAGLNQWYLAYQTIGVDDDDDWSYFSNGPEVNAADANANDIDFDQILNWEMIAATGGKMESAEYVIWPRRLTLSERAQFVAEMDAKYGAMPHT